MNIPRPCGRALNKSHGLVLCVSIPEKEVEDDALPFDVETADGSNSLPSRAPLSELDEPFGGAVGRVDHRRFPTFCHFGRWPGHSTPTNNVPALARHTRRGHEAIDSDIPDHIASGDRRVGQYGPDPRQIEGLQTCIHLLIESGIIPEKTKLEFEPSTTFRACLMGPNLMLYAGQTGCKFVQKRAPSGGQIGGDRNGFSR